MSTTPNDMAKAATEKENYFSAFKLFAKTREGRDPAWMTVLREKAAESFQAIDFPTTRNEHWKYTNISPILKSSFRLVFDLDLAEVSLRTIAPFTFEESRRSQLVFINGLFSRELSDVSGVPEGVCVGDFQDAAAEHGKLISKHLGVYADYRDEAFTALNTAHIGEGAVVYIPEGLTVEKPIHLLFVSTGAEPTSSHPRALIIAGKGSIATVIESYVSAGESVYFTNAVTEVVADEDAVLDHYRLQEESERGFHIGTTEIHQERGSRYTSVSISLGALLSRHDIRAALAAENIDTTIDGLYVTSGAQHHDTHSVIDHQKPHCASHQLYKGILDDRSRAVFNGRVIVREGSLLTDARQLNKNLLLSSEAHIDTKPELEIFADDVKCSHGATVGQLEDDEVFYLASRGLPLDRARALLTYGFAEDVIRNIKLKSAREQLDRIVLEKLRQNIDII